MSAAALAAAQHTRVEGGALGAASHLGAARLYKFRTVDDDVNVSVIYPRKLTVPGARVVRSRDLLDEDITWVDGIPTTTPDRTICDLGLILPEHEVMRILRHAVATTMVNSREVIRMRVRIGEHGRDGAGVIDRCIDELPKLAELTESGVEVLFLGLCDKYQLERPVLQLPVIANHRQYRLDFAYPAQRVFVEIDGAGHGESRQISKDGGRQNDLVACGWQPVRFGYDMLMKSPDYCADVLGQVLSRISGSSATRPHS